jgi:hypothetical protein
VDVVPRARALLLPRPLVRRIEGRECPAHAPSACLIAGGRDGQFERRIVARVDRVSHLDRTGTELLAVAGKREHAGPNDLEVAFVDLFATLAQRTELALRGEDVRVRNVLKT